MKPIPEFLPTQLEECTARDLINLMIENEDRVSLSLFNACVSRMDETVAELKLFYHYLHESNGNMTEGEWWMQIHSLFLLSSIPSDKAGFLAITMLELFWDDPDYEDQNLHDWLSESCVSWRLFANKSPEVIEKAKKLAENKMREHGWLFRATLIEGVLGAAYYSGDKDRLEETMDWIAGFTQDDANTPDFRCFMGMYLLDFPRERHRNLLEQLVLVQEAELEKGNNLSNYFGIDTISRHFNNPDELTFELKKNYMDFYKYEEILKRQQDWEKEDAEEDALTEQYQYDADYHDDDYYEDDNDDNAVSYVRETPKIGRNDPCPCGSGKKYKKCCINK